MEWPREVILEFLRLYKKEPVLWNPKDPNYKNRSVQHDAWKRIETSISVKSSVTALKRKKEALMATFRRLCRKVKISKARDQDFTPEWFAYKYMAKFLDGVYNPVKTEEELMEETMEEVKAEDDTDMNIDIHDVTIKSDPDGTVPVEIADPNVDNDEDYTFKIPAASAFPQGRKRRLKTSDVEHKMDKAYRFLQDVMDKPPPDQCTLYTELLAKKLRNMDDHTREIAMLQIDQLVYRLRFESPHPTAYSSSQCPQSHFKTSPQSPQSSKSSQSSSP